LPLDALALALAAAVVHALWNMLTARAGESQIAAGVALAAGFVVSGGIGATMRLLFRRGREGSTKARFGPFVLVDRD
jgi:hypothetical protein